MHVIIAAINSPTATFKQRNDLLKRLVPELHVLADDKWGSRVADACWDRADGFTKVSQAVLSRAAERLRKRKEDHENNSSLLVLFPFLF